MTRARQEAAELVCRAVEDLERNISAAKQAPTERLREIALDEGAAAQKRVRAALAQWRRAVEVEAEAKRHRRARSAGRTA